MIGPQTIFRNQMVYKIFTLLYSNQEKSYFVRELARTINADVGNLQRELQRLQKDGWIVQENQGKNKYVSLRKDHPYYKIFSELFATAKNQLEKYAIIGEEDNMSFLTTLYNIHGYVHNKGQNGTLPDNFDWFYTIEDGYMKYWAPEQKFIELGKKLRSEMLQGKIDIAKIRDIYKANGEKIITAYKKMRQKDFFSPAEAQAAINDFRKWINEIVCYAWPGIADLAYYTHTNYIRDYLNKKITGTSYTVPLVMEKLLQPEEITISQQMRRELLLATLKEKSGNKKEGRADLRQIYADYRWLNFGWSGPEFDFSFFEQTYNELLLKNVSDLNSEVAALNNTSSIVLAEKNKLRKILKIDSRHFRYIQDVSLLSWLKLYRKDVLFAVNWLTFHILEPYRKKHNYTHKDLSFIALDEVPELLNGSIRLTKKDFAERFHFSVLVPDEKYAHVGEDAKKFLSRFDLAKADGMEEKTLKLLNGMTACLGKTGDWVYGTVRIVNTPKDMKNMVKGDILVSAATTPDILPAMRLAGAIVTDQGGITCHAAIVSRELNLPCLIGTKYATKIFKDGDKVIVCPRHAYIKFQ